MLLNKYFFNQMRRSMILMIVILLSSLSCNKEDEPGNNNNVSYPDPLQPQPAINTTVAGVVIDEEGKPVDGVEVIVHGESTVTGTDGGFVFENIQVPGNRCIVESRKEGYFSGIRALTPSENRQTEVRIVLMGSPVTHTFQASTGSNAVLSNGSEVQIPANGLVTQSGDGYGGPVSMSVRYLDPTAGNFGLLVPGGDMLAVREDQSSSVLYSYGILRVQMTDPAGEPLQLAPGQTSTLIMNIPDDQLSSAPSTIPLWFFDEQKGVWQEEGSATRDGNKYVGTVSHFTDWNCDDPREGATIIGRLVDCNGNAAWGIVEFGQVTSDPQSSTETGESDGRFIRRVPDGVSVTVVITDPLMITPLTPNERGKVIVIVPPLAPDQVYDVGDIKTFPCPSDVTATFKTQPGDRVSYASFSTDYGYKAISYPGQSMKVNLPPNVSVEMQVHTDNGIYAIQNIRTAGEGETLDLGEIDLSSEIVAVGDGLITGKIVCYGEPETSGQISVYWNDGGQNTGINYTAPGPDGSFQIQAPANMAVELSSTTESGTWVKTIQTSSAPGEETALGTIELCENEAVGETSFRITGDGFNNTLFNIVSNQNMEGTNLGMYHQSANVTLAVVDDLGDEIYIFIYFPGKSTGVVTASDEAFVTITRTTASGTAYYWSGYNELGATLDLNITRYDNVGGVIEGTFSGKFLLQDVNKEFTGEQVTISDGKFSVLRYPDGM
jgi:hypothetical protein